MAGVHLALVLQVGNDGCFWAWILSEGEQFPSQLEQIENEIAKHFGSPSEKQFVTTVTKDHNYLVERRPGQWARAVVRKKFQSSKSFAEVLFTDLGTVTTLPTTSTRFLPMPTTLEDYPPQARQFRISGITPAKDKSGSSSWGQTVLKHIQRLSNHSKVYLNLSSTSSEVPEAVLYSIDGHVNINGCLVEAGVAQWTRGEGTGGRGRGAATVVGAGMVTGSRVSEQQSVLDDSGQREVMLLVGREVLVHLVNLLLACTSPVVSSVIECDPVVMVSSPRPLPPVHDLKQLGLPSSLTQKLSDEFRPNPIHTHTWPFILEGDNVLAVCPPSENAKLAFLLPLLATRMKKQQQEGRVPGGQRVATADGPPVVVLCVNSQEVDNVTQMFAFIMSKALAHERFKCVKSYAGIEEDTPVQLLNGCDFFMVTPSSLLRLLKKKQVTLGSLDHLVLHGASDLVESFSHEIKLIMRQYAEAVSEMNRLCFLQVVATTTQCTPDVLSLMEAYAKSGQTAYHTLASCAIESAVVRRTKIEVVKVADFAGKLRWLRDYLLAPSRGSVVVTCVSCDQEMQELKRFIYSHSLPALILSSEQDLIAYKAHLTASQHIVLHDSVLPKGLSQLPLTCHLIHYSLPSTVSLFRPRMALLLKAFRKPLPAEVVVFSDGSSLGQKKYITRLLQRMEHAVPAVLRTEDHESSPTPSSASSYDLCYYFCAFGQCRVRACKLVHSLFSPSQHQHQGPPLYTLPSSGTVKFKVSHVGNGSRMWIQILEHHPAKRGDSPFVPPPSYDMASLLSQYFSSASVLDQERQRLLKPSPGDYCLLADQEGAYHRAHIFGFDREVDGFYHHKERAKVRLLDSGPSLVVELNQLVELPAEFLLQPRQVAEAYVCRIRPNDCDRDFSPQAVAYAQSQFDGKELWGHVVLSHRGTLWLDTVEERIHLAGVGVNMSIRNWRRDLMQRGLAEDNKEHLAMLRGEMNRESPQLLPGCVTLDRGSLCEVLLAAVNSTSEFYLQTKTSCQHLDELFEKLNMDHLSGSAFGKISIEKGQMVAAIFPQDKCWYRGRVVDYSPSSREYQVFFVDYGELQWVSETEVQAISESFLELPCQAVRACLAGLELTPVLAKRAGALLEEIAEDTELTAKVLHVEENGEDCSYHFVQLFDGRGRDLAEILRQQMDESQPMNTQLMTETTPPLPPEALGTLATTLMSPVKSAMDLKRIHANIQEQGAKFPLAESELEWAVCRMGQQSTEVMNEVMNIITALVYHKHPSVKVLSEPRPLEAIQGLLKVVSGGECAKLVLLLRQLLEGTNMDALLCKEWARVFCRVLALLRDTPALQAVLGLMTRMVTERPSLILHLTLEGGLSTVMSMLTVLPDPEVQPSALKVLLAVVTAEEGQDIVLSAGPVKAVVSTLLQAQDKQTLLLALTIAKELVAQKNRHTARLRDPLERILRCNQPLFVRTVTHFLLSALDQLPDGGDDGEEAQPASIPKPIQKVPNPNVDLGLEQTPQPPHPCVLWSQTRPMMILRVQLKDCCSVVVEFGRQSVKLSGVCEGILHSVDLVLYKEIDSEACSYKATAGEIVLRVVKRKRELWPRVTLDKTKFPYLQADFDHLSDSSSGEESDDSQHEEKEGGTERSQSSEVTTRSAASNTRTHPPAQLPPDMHLWVESGSSSPSSSEGEFDTGPDQWSDHDDNFI